MIFIIGGFISKKIKEIILFIVCIMIAFILHRTLTADIVMYFLPSLYSYELAHITLIFIQGLFIYLCVKQVVNKKFDKTSLLSMWICYFTILVFILFFRMKGLRGLNINPLDIINNIKNDNMFVLTIFLNIFMFIPLGYLFKNIKINKALLIGIFVFFIVESFQYIIAIGIFDINDIIFNLIGFLLGHVLGNKLKI